MDLSEIYIVRLIYDYIFILFHNSSYTSGIDKGGPTDQSSR